MQRPSTAQKMTIVALIDNNISYVNKGDKKMQKKIDFRVQRTYKLLTDALIELLKEKDFDSMTVGEICEKAMIRRATFYKHFADKYELFAFVIREIQDEFESRIDKNALERSHPQDFYAMVIKYTVDFVEENKDMVKSILISQSDKLQTILSDEIELEIRIQLKQNQKDGVILPAKPELIAAMITGALIYSIKRWIMSDSLITKDEIVSTCQKLANNI